MIDGPLLAMVALVVVLSLLAWFLRGEDAVRAGLTSGVQMVLRFGLLIVVSFLAAGLIETLVPRDFIRAQLGGDTGVRSLALATGAGMLTPSGPFIAIPMAVTMLKGGAGTPPVLAYISAWGLISLHRLVAWEIPLLGAPLAFSRFGLCLFVPILIGFGAAMISRTLDR